MLKRKGSYEIDKRDNMRGGPGTATVEHIFKKGEFGGPHFRAFARLILPPGAGVGLHAHEGDDEAWLIVRGRGQVSDSGVTTEVGEGDAILTGKGNSHSITNTGVDTLEAIAIIVAY